MVDPASILNAIRTQVQQAQFANYQPPQPAADAIIDQLNKVRTENHLTPLKANQQLDNSAGSKAMDMVNQGYWQHQTPPTDQYPNQMPWEAIRQAGYRYKVAGENLARGYSNDQDTLKAWMASPTHRDNILNPDYTEVGVGRHTDAKGHQYIVTHFGKPQ